MYKPNVSIQVPWSHPLPIQASSSRFNDTKDNQRFKNDKVSVLIISYIRKIVGKLCLLDETSK